MALAQQCHAGLCRRSSPVGGHSPICTRELRAVVTQRGEAAVPQVTAAAPRHQTALRGTPSSTACPRTTAAAAVAKKNIPAAAAVEQEPGGGKHGSDSRGEEVLALAHAGLQPWLSSLCGPRWKPAVQPSLSLNCCSTGKVGSPRQLPLLLIFPVSLFFSSPSSAPSSLSAPASHFGVTFSKQLCILPETGEKAAPAPWPNVSLEAQHRHSSIKPG